MTATDKYEQPCSSLLRLKHCPSNFHRMVLNTILFNRMADFDENPDVGEFFDKLSDDEDRMPGVEEAEEAPDKSKKKTVKAKASISNRIVLNERLLCGPKGLVKYLSHFEVRIKTPALLPCKFM